MADNSPMIYSGVLEQADGRYLLRSGGLVAEVVLAPGEAKESLAALVGRMVTFTGQQSAARIEQAKLSPASARAESADASERARFEPVFAAIDRNAAALAAIPGVVSVRPGFRRTAGHLTDQPAIVVSVRRKLDIDELAPGAVIPREIENIPVDVVDRRSGGDRERARERNSGAGRCCRARIDLAMA